MTQKCHVNMVAMQKRVVATVVAEIVMVTGNATSTCCYCDVTVVLCCMTVAVWFAVTTALCMYVCTIQGAGASARLIAPQC